MKRVQQLLTVRIYSFTMSFSMQKTLEKNIAQSGESFRCDISNHRVPCPITA